MVAIYLCVCEAYALSKIIRNNQDLQGLMRLKSCKSFNPVNHGSDSIPTIVKIGFTIEYMLLIMFKKSNPGGLNEYFNFRS
jgi:hypothetical protein